MPGMVQQYATRRSTAAENIQYPMECYNILSPSQESVPNIAFYRTAKPIWIGPTLPPKEMTPFVPMRYICTVRTKKRCTDQRLRRCAQESPTRWRANIFSTMEDLYPTLVCFYNTASFGYSFVFCLSRPCLLRSPSLSLSLSLPDYRVVVTQTRGSRSRLLLPPLHLHFFLLLSHGDFRPLFPRRLVSNSVINSITGHHS